MIKLVLLPAHALVLLLTSQYLFAQENVSCPETLNFVKQKLAKPDKVDLCDEYKGKVVMIVNTASFCGFTPQYKSLEALYRRYKPNGFVVLGFPSNDFGDQEPGDEEKIKAFCDRTFNVQFPMFQKTSVKRGTNDPLYKKLATLSGEHPQWNFHKYLLDRNGKLAASIPSKVDPSSAAIVDKIESLL